MTKLELKQGCFNCGDIISSERLKYGIPCEKDIPEDLFDIIKKSENKLETIYEILKERNRLFNFKEIYEIEKETQKFIEFFKGLIGFEPWSIQVTWFKRLLKGESFSMVAPTGIGKTTFICVSSIYFGLKGKKSYIILPTTVLVEQVYERIKSFLEKVGEELEVVAYLRKNRQQAKEEIILGDFDILITSNQFLAKNFEILRDKKFDIIFVDDVDAFFKGSKNIERVLQLLGFTEDDIKTATELIKAKLYGDIEKIQELQNKIEEIKKKEHGILVLSSATGRVRGLRTKLYKELLNFSIGGGTTKIRNIIDSYKFPKKDIREEVYELIKRLEDGILVFVTREQGSEFAKELYEYLKERGIKVGLVLSEIKESPENIKKFAEGELNVLIGVAHFYGLLVRGLDLPTRVKYVIFTGIPKIKINLTRRERNIQNLFILGRLLQDILEKDEREKINRILKQLQVKLRRLSGDALRKLSEAFEKNEKLEGYLESLRIQLEELYNRINEYLNKEEILEKIKNHPEVSIKIEDGEIYLQIPDMKTYIQASGRCSRLYAGGITKGLSILLVDDEKLLKALERKLRLLT